MKVSPVLLIVIATILFARPAHAYLDPSTGSMIITAIVGLFASIALAVKTYWYKLKSFFRGDRNKRDTTQPPPAQGQETGPEAGQDRD